MTEERKKNGCCIQLVDYEGQFEFWCTNRFECDFNPHPNAFSLCMYETRANISKCTNTDAHDYTLNLARDSIVKGINRRKADK